MKQLKDNRYARTLKQCLNKIFKNKLSINKELGELISQFSHRTSIKPGQYLLSKNLTFFIVKQVLSNHWVCGYFAPSELFLQNGLFYYLPNFWRRSKMFKKNI